ncbi:MAG: TlpA family protein disulfide reductase [Bryobacterales bacterium]|nr:TlpA family protein disulfide reductase [Bryobacterales bacterium]
MKNVYLRLAALLVVAGAPLSHAGIIQDVRAAIADSNFVLGESRVKEYLAKEGAKPEGLEALSWLGRGALAAKRYDEAERYAAETRKLVLEALKKRPVDSDANTPIALGASIEVHANVLNARGQKGEAVAFLQRELEKYRATSIRTRLQKNIHLLSLEGKPAPALEVAEWLNAKPAPMENLKGHPVLLFFWAHWCSDCKAQAPPIARLMEKYGPKGLILVGPTQRYGYVARGEDAPPEREKPYIESVRREHYGALAKMAVPLSAENFKSYGASSTPTLVLLDRAGVVRMYHPGNMTYQELEEQLEKVTR